MQFLYKTYTGSKIIKKLPFYTVNMYLMTMYGFGHLISSIPDHSEQDWSLCFFQNQAIIDSITFTKKIRKIIIVTHVEFKLTQHFKDDEYLYFSQEMFQHLPRAEGGWSEDGSL